jgi:uncharacterized membrane protein
VSEDKTVAIVSYLTLIGFIVAIILHSSKKTQIGAFHLRQMLGLILFSLGGIIPLIGLLWALFLLVLWVFGLIAAVKGEQKPVPVFGAMFQKWFAGAFG